MSFNVSNVFIVTLLLSQVYYDFFNVCVEHPWCLGLNILNSVRLWTLSTSCRGSLEGKREQKSYKALLEDPMLRFSGLYQENCSDLYVTCQVFAEGKPLALPVRTSYKAFSTRWKWVLICLCLLPALIGLDKKKNPKIVLFFAAGTSGCGCRSSIRTFPKMPRLLLRCGTFMDRARLSPSGEPLSPCLANMGERIQRTRKVFKQTSTERALLLSSMFRQGMHDLKVWPGVEGDGADPTATPGRTSSSLTEDQMGRLAKVTHLCALGRAYFIRVRFKGWNKGLRWAWKWNRGLNPRLFQSPDLEVLSDVS